LMKRVSLAIVALAVSAGVAVAGDVAAGETVFKKCMTCHPGIKNEKDADDLWSYIEQFGPDGKKK
jgi:cytochrome c2